MDAILPAPRVAVTDPRTGIPTREWFRYWELRYTMSGGSSGILLPPFGGTGLSGVDQGEMLYGSGVNTYTLLPKTATASYLSNGGLGNNPAWTAKAALTKADDTNVTLTLGGSPSSSLLTAASITAGWQGQLAESRGGTNQSTYAQGDILYASASNTLAKRAVGTSGKVLQSNGTVPVWSTVVFPAALTANQVLYATSANTAGASANLVFDGSQLALPVTGGTGGVLIGADVQIYRSAANILRTPDNLTVDQNIVVGSGSGATVSTPGTIDLQKDIAMAGDGFGVITADTGGTRVLTFDSGQVGVPGTLEIGTDEGLRLASQTNRAGGASGTLTNAPTAGNPAIFAPIVYNGTTYGFPLWALP